MFVACANRGVRVRSAAFFFSRLIYHRRYSCPIFPGLFAASRRSSPPFKKEVAVTLRPKGTFEKRARAGTLFSRSGNRPGWFYPDRLDGDLPGFCNHFMSAVHSAENCGACFTYTSSPSIHRIKSSTFTRCVPRDSYPGKSLRSQSL